MLLLIVRFFLVLRYSKQNIFGFSQWSETPEQTKKEAKKVQSKQVDLEIVMLITVVILRLSSVMASGSAEFSEVLISHQYYINDQILEN